MKPRDPHYARRAEAIFDGAPFMKHLGVRLLRVDTGLCETTLDVQPWQLQQDGFVHAGVQATLADHTAGAAAGTLMSADEIVLTVEFKINLLRPAQGESLICRARVLRPGSQITVAESEVFARVAGHDRLTAKAMVTLTYVPAR